MNWIPLISFLGPFITWLLFNTAFFMFVSHALNKHPVRWKTYGLTFIINFIAFMLMSAFELVLVVNWTIVALLLVVETKALYRVSLKDCLLLALIGALLGLVGTIIMRSVCALALDVPLSTFSNDTEKNRSLPISLGFLLSAISLHGIDTPANQRILSTTRSGKRTLISLLVELSLCYLYLCLNLLLYYNDLNSLFVKLWSLKTALFVALGSIAAIWFSYRISSVLAQSQRHAKLQHELEQDEFAGKRLRELAEHDILTGCFTRTYAEQAGSALLESGTPFSIVFADLDLLKYVNDHQGHNEGDAYIVAAADALDQTRESSSDFIARYGGDEFLVVLNGALSPHDVAERMEVASHILSASASPSLRGFVRSFSWGYAAPRDGDTFASIVARADAEMYGRKRDKARAS